MAGEEAVVYSILYILFLCQIYSYIWNQKPFYICLNRADRFGFCADIQIICGTV